MKKRTLLLILVILVLLSGCDAGSEQAEGPAPTGGIGYDSQDKYLMLTGYAFQETETIYCGSNFSGDYLYYYDRATGTSGVLCADPTCTHDSYTCSAYLTPGSSPCYYDGKLYWTGADQSPTDDCLWRSDLIGVNREKIKDIIFDDVILAYQPQQYTIHRGRLYFIGFNTNVESTESGYRMSLVSTSLDDSEEFTAIFDRTTNLAMMPTMRFSGSCAYFSWYREDENGEEVFTIEKYDTETEIYGIVLEEAGLEDLPDGFWVTEDGEVYISGADDARIYIWHIRDGELEEAASWENTNYYKNAPYLMDGIAVNTTKNDGIKCIAVRSFTGEVLYEGTMYTEETPDIAGDPNEYITALVGGDAEKLIYTIQHPETRLSYTFMLDVQDNMKLTLLWGDELVINKG